MDEVLRAFLRIEQASGSKGARERARAMLARVGQDPLQNFATLVQALAGPHDRCELGPGCREDWSALVVLVFWDGPPIKAARGKTYMDTILEVPDMRTGKRDPLRDSWAMTRWLRGADGEPLTDTLQDPEFVGGRDVGPRCLEVKSCGEHPGGSISDLSDQYPKLIAVRVYDRGRPINPRDYGIDVPGDWVGSTLPPPSWKRRP